MFLKRIILISFIGSTLIWGLDINVSKVKLEVVPIIEAIKANKYNSFKKLFNKRKLLKRYNQNRTLLHYASRYNNQRVAKWLVQKGALLSAVGGEYNATPLHTAIRYGYLDLAVYLIKNKAPLNIRDKYNETALDIAIRLNYSTIIHILKKKGAVGDGSSHSDELNKYKNGNAINKYRSGNAVNKYGSVVRAQKVKLRHNKIESENEDKNNKVIGKKNSTIDIGN